MADIELVIEIPDIVKTHCDDGGILQTIDIIKLKNAVAHGTPLLEPHGDLKDATAIEKEMLNYHDDCAQTSEYTRLGFETAMGVVKDAETIIPATETPTDKYTKVPACNGYTFYVPKQVEEKEEKSCETCIRQDDDPMSGECYECVKGIIDHYEPAMKEDENE